VADQAALDDAADAAALGVDAVGGDVVDVAVLHQHGVAVDIVDALGVAGVAQAGIVDFAASDGDVVRAGDLHAVAAGAVDDAVLHQRRAGVDFERVEVAALQLKPPDRAVARGAHVEGVVLAADVVGVLDLGPLAAVAAEGQVVLGDIDAARVGAGAEDDGVARVGG